MPLTDQQMASWRFEDASNLGTDSVGANNLTNNNAATQAAGKVGRALSLASASSQSLSVASNANLQLGGSAWEITAWVYPTALTTSRIILGKWSPTVTEYVLYWEASSSKFTIGVESSFNQSLVFWDTGVVATTLSTWYFLDVYADPTANAGAGSITIAQNNTGARSTAFIGPQNNTQAFAIGVESDLSTSPWNGRIDEVNLWKRLLTPAERTALFVGGSRRRTVSAGY